MSIAAWPESLPKLTRAEVRLIERGFRSGWAVEPERRREIVAALELVRDTSPRPRLVLAAEDALAAAQGLDRPDRHQVDRSRPRPEGSAAEAVPGLYPGRA